MSVLNKDYFQYMALDKTKYPTIWSIIQSSAAVEATLVQRHRKDTDRKEWALVSKKDPSKILKWFGVTKPSEESVLKEERRVQYFKHLG